MFSRVIRAVLFGASVLALWLVAVPAFASESDERGAADAADATDATDATGAAAGAAESDARAARAAANAAPLCDDRGATRLAPPPIMQPEEVLLELDETPSCPAAANFGSETAQTAHRASNSSSPEGVSGGEVLAAFPSSPTHVLSPDRTPAVSMYEAVVLSSGVRGRVDRPPRA